MKRFVEDTGAAGAFAAPRAVADAGAGQELPAEGTTLHVCPSRSEAGRWPRSRGRSAIPLRRILFLLVYLGTALGIALAELSGALAFGLGLVLALGFGAPGFARPLGQRTLEGAIVVMGFGQTLEGLVAVGGQGLGLSFATLALTFGLGLWLARCWRIEREAALLVTAGTAICGGSAIAAVAGVLRARPESVGIALGIVLTLNAFALVLFPWLGPVLGFEGATYGFWCALAIHDTSAVVGAAALGGPQALAVATIAKLARALWIFPVAFALGLALRRKGGPRQMPPWFLVGFLAASASSSLHPMVGAVGAELSTYAPQAMSVALFLLGSAVQPRALYAASGRTAALGCVLWIALAGASAAWLLVSPG